MIIFTYRFSGKTHCTKITQLVDRVKLRNADRVGILNRKNTVWGRTGEWYVSATQHYAIFVG